MRVKKYLILLGDGMPDEGKITPLMAAKKENIDRLTKLGEIGSVLTAPDDFEPGSDVTNLGILGYDVRKYYTGRAPIEAAASGIAMKKNEIAFRTNLVTLKPEGSSLLMEDFSAGHIDTESAEKIISSLNDKLGSETVKFYPGVSYRHIMIGSAFSDNLDLSAPHDIAGKNIFSYLPKGETADKLVDLMNHSQMILKDHPVNKERERSGKALANSIWFWGKGRSTFLPKFYDINSLKAGMITAVDLMRGIAILSGMTVIDVEGATGWLDTNFKGKADAAIENLNDHDFIYLHLEAADEAGHVGSFKDKVAAIESFDKFIVGPIVDYLEKEVKDFRLLFLSDHPTPYALKKHTRDPVPFLIYPALNKQRSAESFDEKIVSDSKNHFHSVLDLNGYFINGQIG